MAKKLTSKEFERIKELTGLIPNVKKVADLVGRGSATIHRIKLANDFNDYRRIITHSNRKKDTKPELFKKQVGAPIIRSDANTAQALDYKLLNDNLVLMADKIDKLTAALEANAIATYALRKTHTGDKKWWGS